MNANGRTTGRTISIAICADRNMEAGLHVTLYSVLSQMSANAKVFLILRGYSSRRIDLLRETLRSFDNRHELVLLPFNTLPKIASGKGLHGNSMPYSLVSFAKLVPDTRLVCLDADLVCFTDICELIDMDLGNAVAAAYSAGPVKYSWDKERKFLEENGVPTESPYFNTGVLLVDTGSWNNSQVTERSLELIDRCIGRPPTADQSILNVTLSGRVAQLDRKFNTIRGPRGLPIDLHSFDGILHMAGSPKPWDLFGRSLSSHWAAYNQFASKTAIYSNSLLPQIAPHRLLRTILLTRSYWRALSTRTTPA